MRILADSNILARIAQPAHCQHQSALQAVEELIARGDDPCVVPQVIYEFWVVATRPASANGLEMTISELEMEFQSTRETFTWLLDERAIYHRWEHLVRSCEVRGKSAHDARLLAAMQRHDLTSILTFNASDFLRFAAITVVTPEMVLAARRSSGGIGNP